MRTDMGAIEERAGVMPAPETMWARPLWISGRFGIGQHTLERAWKAGKVRRSKLDDGRAGTVLYFVADIERWVNEHLDDPNKQKPAKPTTPHPRGINVGEDCPVRQPVPSAAGGRGVVGTTDPDRP